MQIENLNFMDKVVSFSTNSSTLGVFNPVLKEQASRLFIVGTVADGSTTNNWARGKSCAIAWDSITDYIVFESIDEYITLLAKSD